MSQVENFHWHEVEGLGPVVHPTTPDDCEQCKGVGTVYRAGDQWGVKRNDVDPDGPLQPAYYHFSSEAEARDWYEGMIQSAQLCLPDDQDRWPELVCAPLAWRVVANGR